MTLYYFTALGNNGYYSFNPATDKLIFNVPFVTAAEVSLAMLAGGSTRFSVLGKTFTMGGFGLDEVTLSNVLFISGAGVLRVGDNSVGTTGDSYGNAIGGTSGNDKLYGMGGNDSIYGNGGSDVVGGGGGNDLVNGGLGSDTASYFDAAGNVFVNLNFGA